jgi:hypothetical protein
MLRLVPLAAALALLAGPAVGESAAACTPPAKATAYDNTADGSGGAVTGSLWFAQSFTVSAPIELAKVSLRVQHTGDSQPLTAEIHSDAGGNPGALLGTSTATRNGPGYVFLEFDFSAAHIPLAQGVTYYIVAHSTSSYQLVEDGTSPTYPAGKYFQSDNSGATWTSDAAQDLLFQVFGQTCTPDTQPPATPLLPAASGLAFSNKAFRAESSGPSATRKKAPRGTRVSFNLNEAASVRFTVTRRAKGRKSGRKCVKRTRKNRKRKRCTRTVTLKGGFTRNGAAGTNSFHFTGRLRGRKLKPGRYRLVATPSAGGTKGKSISRSFRIVR